MIGLHESWELVLVLLQGAIIGIVTWAILVGSIVLPVLLVKAIVKLLKRKK